MVKSEKKYAIVYGNDHTNSLGVVQALGREGVCVTAVLWGTKTGIVASSRYAGKVLHGENAQACIEIILRQCVMDKPVAIIPCTDEAAVVLEENAGRLEQNFRFQRVMNYSMGQLEDKNAQTELAEKSGLCIPRSHIAETASDIPEDFPYPCLIKPVLSTEGRTSDIQVCGSREELSRLLEEVLPRTGRILLQQYIEKDSDCGLIGCRMSSGEMVLPCIIDRPRIFPPKTGLGTLYALDILDDPELYQGIRNYIETIGYVGLFSFEFAKSVHDGKYYFIEANFRNDGENPCLVKAGYNIIYAHYCDLMGLEIPTLTQIRPVTVISEIRHLRSMNYGHISKKQWLKDIVSSDGFMSYYKDDKKPIYTVVVRNFLLPRVKDRLQRLFGVRSGAHK